MFDVPNDYLEAMMVPSAEVAEVVADSPTETIVAALPELTEVTEVVEADGSKVPRGSKRCNNCHRLVKGPRTKACPSCGTLFGKKTFTRNKAATAAKIPKRSKPILVADPHTIRENVIPYTVDPSYGRNKMVNAIAVRSYDNQYLKVRDYLRGIENPKGLAFANSVVTTKD